MTPYFVGISGGSASGKTFLLNHLTEAFGEKELTLISMDNYYKDQEYQVLDEYGMVNYDAPSAMMLDLLQDHLNRLRNGESVSIREYTFNNPDIPVRQLTYHPTPVIVIEGIFAFHVSELRESYDLKLFVDADEHLKLSRRIRRDILERTWDLDTVLLQYERYIIPSYRQYIEPYKRDCDFILNNNKHLKTAANVIRDHLRCVIQERMGN